MKFIIAIALAGLTSAFATPCVATHGDDLRTDRAPYGIAARGEQIASWKDDFFTDLNRTAPLRPTIKSNDVLASWKDDFFTDLNRTAPLRRELKGPGDGPFTGE